MANYFNQLSLAQKLDQLGNAALRISQSLTKALMRLKGKKSSS